MKILYLGDVVGRSGRQGIKLYLAHLKQRLSIDCAIVNVENSAHGFGVTKKMCEDFFSWGADVLTTGDHVWDQKDLMPYIDNQPHLLRPLNYPKGSPGNGMCIYEMPGGVTLGVIQLLGRVFMNPVDCPFQKIQDVLENYSLKGKKGGTKALDAIMIDFHAEATSEKMAMGHFCDGQISFLVGSHTHVPTADSQILVGGTGYQTDAGMCGDYDSVIGMQKMVCIEKLRTKLPIGRFQPAQGQSTLCGVVCDIDEKTGLTRSIDPVRFGGGRLKNTSH